LKEIGDEEKATRTSRGEPAFEQGGDVMVDAVPGDNAWARLAGAVEDFDGLLGKEPGRECGRGQPFFLDRP
jgi:hypothetical protein